MKIMYLLALNILAKLSKLVLPFFKFFDIIVYILRYNDTFKPFQL
jgi:hypothetical protein